MLGGASTPSTGKATQKDGAENLNRACEPCRLLKVRCLPDPESKSGICQRCNKSKRSCVFTAPQKRRQRVRTDTRVAELEREVRAMRAMLDRGGSPRQAKPQEGSSRYADCDDAGSRTVDDDQKSSPSSPLTEPRLYDTSESGRSLLPSQPSTPEEKFSLTDGCLTRMVNAMQHNSGPKSSDIDFVERGLLPFDTANELYEMFIHDAIPLVPVVILPAGYTSSAARAEKPVLFAAIITATSCQLDPTLFSCLSDEMNRIYAERILVKGQKSLELIQAILITSLWYCPPDVGEAKPHRFFQLINLAASMAVDIGIGTQIDDSARSLEECRALLGCYISCSSISMRMGRQNMLQWSSRMADCLKAIEVSPAATIHDRGFAAWVKHQNIVDEYFESSNGVDEAHRQPLLRSFKVQLERWRSSLGPNTAMDGFLGHICQQNNIFIYEALFGGADPRDLNHLMFNTKEADVPPSFKVLQAQSMRLATPLSTASLSAITACIDQCQTSMDEFLTLDIKTLRLSPIFLYVRLSYAIVILIKFYISSKDSSNELSKILDPRTLKIETYFPAIIERVTHTAGPRRLRIPTKWLSILVQIEAIYRYYEDLLDNGKEISSLSMTLFDPIVKKAVNSNAYLSQIQEERNLMLGGGEPTSPTMVPPSVLPTTSDATPQAMYTQEDMSLSMPWLNAFPMIFGDGESDLSLYSAPNITATDPNNWSVQGSGTMPFEQNWEASTRNWNYNFK